MTVSDKASRARRVVQARMGLALLIAALLPGGQSFAAPVDDLRLQSADSADWLTYGRDYTNQRFSPLAQIDRASVQQLAPRWTFHTGVNATFQATPLVADGIIYLSTPFDHVVAIDGRDGHEIWRYSHQRTTARMCCGPANRGVALGYGKVFIGTVDGRLIALDAKTGKPVWDSAVADTGGPSEATAQVSQEKALQNRSATGSTGAGINMAPLVVGGKVIVGIAGVGYGLHLDSDRPDAPIGGEVVAGFAGNYGRSGFYAAFDAETGKRVWQFDTIAARGWEGQFGKTTPDGIALPRDIAHERKTLAQYPDAARHGGGSAWTTPAYDPRTGMLFVGTGNPSPQMEDASRPGDNLYSAALIALDVNTGRMRWHYQQVPHDLWGYDVASPPVLFDLPGDHGPVAAVGQASKLGWYYVHDRATGRLIYKSQPFVPQENLFALPTAEGVRITPGAAGGANWSPSAYDPETGLAYVAASHIPIRYQKHILPPRDGQKAVEYTTLEPVDGPTGGTVTAISTRDQGRIRWQVQTKQPMIGGMLATAGKLVFTGEGNGKLDAFDAETGALLWQYACGAGVNAPPITYEIDGTQYVAVAVGGNSMFGFRTGDTLMVFALPKP